MNRLYLAAKADKTRKFYTLKDKVCRTDVLTEAWKRVKANKGAAGVDAQSIYDIESEGAGQFLAELQKELLAGTYRVECVRRVFIPKRDGRRMRPLGIPTVKDRVVQEAVKLVIEPIFEADFQPFSYGYRPKMSATQASAQVYKYLNFGLTTVIDVDIEGFFDHVNHDRLISLVMERVADGFVIGLIRRWLRAGVVYLGTTSYPEAGTPQGGVISPLLANVYLNRVDARWVRLGMENRDTKMVRYADDSIILTSKAVEEAQRIKDELSGLLGELGLQFNPDKSRITTAMEGFDFLSFHYRRRLDQRRGKMVTRFYPSERAVVGFRGKVKAAIPLRRASSMREEEAIRTLNSIIVGWGAYFRHSNAANTFSHLQRFVEWKLLKFIWHRHRLRHTGKNRETFEWFHDTLGLKSFGTIVYLRT